MSDVLWPNSFKVKNRQIFFNGKMVEDTTGTWNTTTELVISVTGFKVKALENYIAEHGQSENNSILLDFIKQQRKYDHCPAVLSKWMKSYGLQPLFSEWCNFEFDVESGKYPCAFVEADVSEMDDDEVMSFVRKHRRHNIPIWHELRMHIYRINFGDEDYFEYCDKQQERRSAYRYAAGRIANMNRDDIWEMMENIY